MKFNLIFVFVVVLGLRLVAQESPCDSMFTLPETFDLETMTDSTRFKPEFKNGEPEEYSFSIRDRWGGTLFETSIPEQGWNGKMNNRGGMCGATSYMWILSFTTSDSLQYNCQGFVTLTNTDAKVKVIAIDTLQCRPSLFIPDAFTPNGDGPNDVFIPVFGCPPTEYEFYIFDRWGNLIFQSVDVQKGWDGTRNGTPSQIDTYVWKIKCRFYEGDKKRQFTGHVALIR